MQEDSVPTDLLLAAMALRLSLLDRPERLPQLGAQVAAQIAAGKC